MDFPFFITDNHNINSAYRLALATLCANILPFKDGILEEAEPVMIAGLGYSTPWTRDAAINTWNAGGLICSDVAKNTLFSVLKKNDNGYYIDGEYWDKIIWTIGAWNFYLYTGDKEFLKIAFEATKNTLIFLEETEFCKETNLFRGPACYGDGVAAYPDIYASHGQGGIINFAKYCSEYCEKIGVGIPMYALSTNCLYYMAYILVDRMADELGLEGGYKQKAEAIKAAINKTFWNKEKQTYNYLCDRFGGSDAAEGMGLSFAILFNIADAEQKNKILDNTFVSEHGIPCVYPSFSRYDTPDGLGLGRHSGTVWPHIQGFFADAAAKSGRADVFNKEFCAQTENAVRFKEFAEIYHPVTGEMYGGRQESRAEGLMDWKPFHYQTWSATAYLRNVYFNLLGMNFETDGIHFNPVQSNLLYSRSLKSFKYRNAVLNVTVKGNGAEIHSFMINGEECDPFISADSKGAFDIEITLI